MGFLTDLVEQVRRDLEREPLDDAALMRRCLASAPPRDFVGRLRDTPAPAVIAEVKRSSPSAGPIADADPGLQAKAYEAAGAAAISVLTESRHFGGSIGDLRAARISVQAPILRKDFLIQPTQLLQSRAEGADAVLLIAACMSADELDSALAIASDLGLGVVLEAHSDEDLDKALATTAQVIGVNARDLETLDVDVERALGRLGRIPVDRVAVLESGISDAAQVQAAVAAGAHAVLVGEALMRSPDPGAKLRELAGAGVDRAPSVREARG